MSFSSFVPSQRLSLPLRTAGGDSVVYPSGGGLYQILRRKPKASPIPSFSISRFVVCQQGVGADAITQIAHNKVLVAAAISAAIGQLSKPFTSAFLYGNNFSLKGVFQAGGFPSTHSSAAVATATSLCLERGFSDGIFGLAVVYASLTMYDAQGVRREVGTHAKALNKVLLNTQLNPLPSSDNIDDSSTGKSSNLESGDPHILEELNSFGPNRTNPSLLLGSDNPKAGNSSTLISSTLATDVTVTATDVTVTSENVVSSCAPLKESVGHTEIEVLAGALLGFFVSLAVSTT